MLSDGQTDGTCVESQTAVGIFPFDVGCQEPICS